MSEELDRKYMARALQLALRGAGHTRPNPMVGAVLVKDGRIIGEGWHKQYGGPHAEVNAFASATEDPEGATLYVSLEPCSHYGKTPPCADLIIRKKVARVVAALEDPNPLVSGRGFRKLRANGIRVTVGVLAEEARHINDVFLTYVTRKRPFVLYKAAMSLDGKIACHTGESQWISSEKSREEVQRLRGILSGIMVGAGTVIADNPRLTCRMEEYENPARIIVDGKLRVPVESRIFHEPGRNIILTTSEASLEKKKALENLGVELIEADSEEPGKVDLKSAMLALGIKGIDGILLEGGPTLAASALEAGIIDAVRFYIAQKIIGGREAPSPFAGTGAAHMNEVVPLTDAVYGTSGDDLWIQAYIQREKKEPEAGEQKAEEAQTESHEETNGGNS
ncbi:bifunctional diaminohydroxyphosphoribosylaminopyrimidine deaminase/5-amino-6-(5-phosphoribosylamino)uracil reductase RibD [Allisonella histaminiformans]|uniref:bifunctional diaminohydroxyphosphoribosylaminopyrimidine deaminase/5-amino-6-(5-phosphoribosylamino)uracil reductase RibD n=1 Tax=Allisonella histaminiformans TaxID=209880 RepID=UPI00240A70C7|nr:bifunctional diaminohydroxyphosphoribosylaminopyrimidine deaminase/5-amino-6-(5-phosphoribosylamino)uracil reductase RibD [Allisonella histaminiformans]MDD6870451.1 bifunctional diaminohydroxyphosphoribosylaminopyrimidine deaminase/5-amino-6-(5-phosphoribosylamino)uracil reductase RibD [Allisonella histaminiformans]